MSQDYIISILCISLWLDGSNCWTTFSEYDFNHV